MDPIQFLLSFINLSAPWVKWLLLILLVVLVVGTIVGLFVDELKRAGRIQPGEAGRWSGAISALVLILMAIFRAVGAESDAQTLIDTVTAFSRVLVEGVVLAIPFWLAIVGMAQKAHDYLVKRGIGFQFTT